MAMFRLVDGSMKWLHELDKGSFRLAGGPRDIEVRITNEALVRLSGEWPDHYDAVDGFQAMMGHYDQIKLKVANRVGSGDVSAIVELDTPDFFVATRLKRI